MDRNATGRWTGDLRTGSGTVRLGSGAFEGSYSFMTRFEGAPGTNPEELLGAAHAGCFSMAPLARRHSPRRPGAGATSSRLEWRWRHVGNLDAWPKLKV